MKRVLLTGAGGGVGRKMRQALQGVYPILRLSDIVDLDPAGPGEEVEIADFTRADDRERMLRDVDGIIHLGGISVEDDWDEICRVNIDATYRLFEAAWRAGVRRIAFASSNHSIGFYPRGQRLDGSERPRPDCRYGLSKVFGEGLAQYFADNYGMGILSIRIGWCFEEPSTPRHLAAWVSISDLTQLCRIGLEAPDLHHEIVYGVSDNSRTWWDNRTARRLGFIPQDSSDKWIEAIESAAEPEPGNALALGVQGGPFASTGYEGDPARVLPKMRDPA